MFPSCPVPPLPESVKLSVSLSWPSYIFTAWSTMTEDCFSRPHFQLKAAAIGPSIVYIDPVFFILNNASQSTIQDYYHQTSTRSTLETASANQTSVRAPCGYLVPQQEPVPQTKVLTALHRNIHYIPEKPSHQLNLVQSQSELLMLRRQRISHCTNRPSSRRSEDYVRL